MTRAAPTVAPSTEYPATTAIHLCTEMQVPAEKMIEAAIKAVEENPKNRPLHRPPTGFGIGGNDPLRMALVTEHRWKPGRTLRIRFMEGDPEVQERVKAKAKEWENYANLKLNFVDNGDADIRISFRPGGSWSYLGTVALVIDPSDPTMNYGWLTGNSSDEEVSRVVLHEFGHALAAIHEHSHPQSGIPWDKPKLYQYYSVTQGWSSEEVDRQVLARYEASTTNFSSYDPTSIMHYAVPNELTIGDFEVGWNRQLSDLDKEFITVMYPKDEGGVTELRPGVAVEASIGKHGEEDEYRFAVPAVGGRYELETRGPTDVVMALYGPDDETRLIASDDDSGHAFNARLVRTLSPGEYSVRIRHYSSWGTGSYSIRLQPV